MFLAECVFNVQPDFTLTYIGGLENMGQIQAYQLEDQFAAVTQDINNDGQGASKVNIIYLDKNSGSEEMAAMYNMADIEMAGGDAVVFLFSADFLDRYADYGFIDLSQYVQEFGIGEELLRYDGAGNVFAIEMKENPILPSLIRFAQRGSIWRCVLCGPMTEQRGRRTIMKTGLRWRVISSAAAQSRRSKGACQWKKSVPSGQRPTRSCLSSTKNKRYGCAQ